MCSRACVSCSVWEHRVQSTHTHTHTRSHDYCGINGSSASPSSGVFFSSTRIQNEQQQYASPDSTVSHLLPLSAGLGSFSSVWMESVLMWETNVGTEEERVCVCVWHTWSEWGDFLQSSREAAAAMSRHVFWPINTARSGGHSWDSCTYHTHTHTDDFLFADVPPYH